MTEPSLPFGGIPWEHHLQRLKAALDASEGSAAEAIAAELHVCRERVEAWLDAREPVPEWAIVVARRVHRTPEPRPWAVSQRGTIADVDVELVSPFPREDKPDQYGVTYDGTLVAAGMTWGEAAGLMRQLLGDHAAPRTAAAAFVANDRAVRDRHGR